MFDKFLSIIGRVWGFLFFIGVPLGYTLPLFFEVEPPNKFITVFFVISIFVTSFENVFKRHREFLIYPQILKMLVAIYVTIFGFACIYKSEGLIQAGNITHKSIDALYFSIVTWTTLGYGDLQPIESIKLLAALEALLGTLFIPLLLATIIFIFQLGESHSMKPKDSEEDETGTRGTHD
jgi:hypothetical protein